ncbi:MAG: GH3 auxin-responsive promoter family protein [Saprospiraceae bacterium]
MREILNKILSRYLIYRYSSIDKFIKSPYETQELIFNQIIESGKRSEWGEKYGYDKIKNYKDFSNQVPINVYDELKPYISRMMHGETDVLWPGKISMFSKSSGTTEDKSKYIPVTMENLKDTHIKGGWDAVSILYKNRPDSKLFAAKNLIMGGSLHKFDENPDVLIGDVSALMMSNMPYIGKAFHTPDMSIALLSDWNEKIPKMAEITARENVALFGGVPSWLLVLFRRILEDAGKEKLTEIWPNLEAFMHGGVNFAPYREQFKSLIPKKDFLYFNVYNSSEGYFAIQNEISQFDDDMLLLLNSQIFYEFIPFEQYGRDNPDSFTINEVEKDVNYVMIISNNSGLWRYVVGDTVEFTSLEPHKIRITGRTKHFINVFGEEVMVSNTDKALEHVLSNHDAVIYEYTVAPIFIDGNNKGGHQWVIEFSKEPKDIKIFQKDLDLQLQSINSDYEAKRFNSYVLQELTINSVKPGTFYKWMESRGKLGGQNKVPRLSNSRKFVEELITIGKTI